VPALLVAGGMLLVGCGSGSGRDSQAGAHATIRERDFKIAAPGRLPAGRLDLDVDNAGPDDHELILVRTSRPLPRRSDGLTVDEDAVDPSTVGALEPGLGERHLIVDLRPGRYEMFCNMQGHYLAGMRRSFRVG
jgi:uncharacterized cupredoxin-like copper-binding protein